MRLLQENLKLRSCCVDLSIAWSKWKTEVWDFPVMAEWSRLLSCILYGTNNKNKAKKPKLVQRKWSLHLVMRIFLCSFILSNRTNQVNWHIFRSKIFIFVTIYHSCEKLWMLGHVRIGKFLSISLRIEGQIQYIKKKLMTTASWKMHTKECTVQNVQSSSSLSMTNQCLCDS